MNKKMFAASVAAMVTAGLAGSVGAQTMPQVGGTNPLNLPSNPVVYGSSLPSVVKATAIVNGEIITQTDIDQRLALVALANDAPVPQDQIELLRQQVLRALIDETLQIQAARAAEIEVAEKEIDRGIARIASGMKKTPEDMPEFFASRGASIRSMRRQLLGDISWRRLQSAKIESGVSVGDDEVKAVVDRMTASKGMPEYRVGEIFLAATLSTMDQAMANANQILTQLRQGGSFSNFARQFSEASTAAVGGDLGWVRPEILPEPIANAVRNLQPGQVSIPIAVPGGVSIIALQDTRRLLTADPRAAVLALKQISVVFPAGTTKEQQDATITRFGAALKSVGGCGGAEKVAGEFNGEVVQADNVSMKELPPVLQNMMLPMQVGQATAPFRSDANGVRALVICGRDEVDPTIPTNESVLERLTEERINMRARRYLRDLRRDAVIDFR